MINRFAHELFVNIEYTEISSETIKLSPLSNAFNLTKLQLHSEHTRNFKFEGSLPTLQFLETRGFAYRFGLQNSQSDHNPIDINFTNHFPNLIKLKIQYSPVIAKVLNLATLHHPTLANLDLNYVTHFQPLDLKLELPQLRRFNLRCSKMKLNDSAFESCPHMNYLVIDSNDDSMQLDTLQDCLDVSYFNLSAFYMIPKLPRNLADLVITIDGPTFNEVQFPNTINSLKLTFENTDCIDLDSTNLSTLPALKKLQIIFTNYNMEEAVKFTTVPRSLKMFKCYTRKAVPSNNFGLRSLFQNIGLKRINLVLMMF
ncbi:unnamed protein product [Ambrosiozyma monospora]|uniref:Unnamed protein product n=1 Tax=Ambrosiozyma monospora TaxID=43982 RepID=A0ACB5TFU1_AMBMO|nr:unnamed protein product [Ambrosiozyma monospora]